MRNERKIAVFESNFTIIGRAMSLMNRYETGMRRNRKFPNEPKDSGE